MSDLIRTRFAPSPTGYMHVGGVRTALFAWLVARNAGGKFILRLEDTDQKREVEGSAEHLMSSLRALGLDYDEGPDVDGAFGPYRQSDRLEIYRAWAQKLIDSGRAYADPYTPEEIQTFREQARAEKQAFLYRHHRPENPPAWDGTMPLRFKSDPKPYEWHDEVMGELSTGPEVIDDFILIKSDGYPTYNFAHIVDDAEMQISYIIRGQEFISSQPNYLNLYEALGLEHPIFATMPHILGESGNKKLGKRDGAKDVLDYLQDGILTEALVNFIASMGWNDGTEQEIFSRDELIETFSLDRVQRSGARFDEQRLLWLNGQWIRRLTLDDLYERVADFWPAAAHQADENYKKHVLGLVQDRLKTLTELPMMCEYFFVNPAPNWQMVDENKQLKKYHRADLVNLLAHAKSSLEASKFDPESIQNTLNHLLETSGQKPGILFSLIRLAVSWAPFSPALNDTLSALGKDIVLERLQKSDRNSNERLMDKESDDTLAQRIWDYMTIETSLQPADAIVVGGCSDKGVAEYASDLYLTGFAPVIVFSGHQQAGMQTTEADFLARIARERGVPEAAILRERTATNTGQNIILAQALLTGRDITPHTVILVHEPYMSRRFLATAQAQWQGNKPVFVPRHEAVSFVEYSMRRGRGATIHTMLGDFARMRSYAKKGFQTPQEIPGQVQMAYDTLVWRGHKTR